LGAVDAGAASFGHYEVFVYLPWGTNRTHRRLTTISSTKTLSSSPWISGQGRQWVSLGTYTFNADGTEFIHLEAVTKETADTRTVAFDAVKFVFRAP
jgi:hypothetical protein